MPDSEVAIHHHHDFGIPAGYQDPAGRSIDNTLLGQLVGAAFDGCGPCQQVHLAALVGDASTTARLVELACIATHAANGGLPVNLTDVGVPGMASPEFRRMARTMGSTR